MAKTDGYSMKTQDSKLKRVKGGNEHAEGKVLRIILQFMEQSE